MVVGTTYTSWYDLENTLYGRWWLTLYGRRYKNYMGWWWTTVYSRYQVQRKRCMETGRRYCMITGEELYMVKITKTTLYGRKLEKRNGRQW